MDDQHYLAALRRDSAGLLEAAGAADPATMIESCPEWRPIDLAWHIGEVHHFWGAIVRERMSDPHDYEEPTRPTEDVDVFAFAERSATDLEDVLASVDPATPLWTWSTQQDAAFVIRRMAQETAVHRYDAERAAGRDHRIDAELASDGIDEFLMLFTGRAREGSAPLDGTVHVHCTDVAGEWLVRQGDDGALAVTREHAKGDAAIRGPAHDLLLVCWRRRPLDTVEVIGDRAVAERFVAYSGLE